MLLAAVPTIPCPAFWHCSLPEKFPTCSILEAELVPVVRTSTSQNAVAMAALRCSHVGYTKPLIPTRAAPASHTQAGRLVNAGGGPHAFLLLCVDCCRCWLGFHFDARE